jgi:hypothetical protein
MFHYPIHVTNWELLNTFLCNLILGSSTTNLTIFQFWLKYDNDKGHYQNMFLGASHRKNHIKLHIICPNANCFQQNSYFTPKALFSEGVQFSVQWNKKDVMLSTEQYQSKWTRAVTLCEHFSMSFTLSGQRNRQFSCAYVTFCIHKQQPLFFDSNLEWPFKVSESASG